MTQYECDLSDRKVVTCIPIDRFFRVYESMRIADDRSLGGGLVELGADELREMHR